MTNIELQRKDVSEESQRHEQQSIKYMMPEWVKLLKKWYEKEKSCVVNEIKKSE